MTWAIFGTFSLTVFLLVLVLFVVVPMQADDFLSRTLWERGQSIAREIEGKVVISPRDVLDEQASATLGQVVAGDRDNPQAWVLVCAQAACRPSEVIAHSPGMDPGATTDVLQQFNEQGQPVLLNLTSGHLLSAYQATLKSGAGRAWVLVALDRARVSDVLRGLRRTLFIALLVSMIAFVAVVGVLSRVLIIGPISAMRAMALRLSEADLTGRMEGAATKELDELSDALNSIGQGLRDTLGRIRGVSESVAQVIDQISRTATSTTSGAATVLAQVEETSSSVEQMLASLRGIAENVETLASSAEESSTSILEMATTNEEVAQNVTKMAASVEETTSAIEQMTYSAKEVARNIQDLGKTTEVTASAIHEMDVTISQVETNAYETARLSEQVSADAASGMESIQKTIVGIDKIKGESTSASHVIDQLARRIGEIGNIVDVIDDVAEQTNLLALNAAIIAAQAGEHGKGFAVVAEEIKDLAERTGASTREIADVIRAVQQESRNTMAAMTQGVRSIEEGVELGREAEGALKKILESSSRSTQMVKAIARATVEQARGSKDVTASVERIRDSVESINKATTEQARGADQIMKSAEHMRRLTQFVTRSVQEQEHGSKQIHRAIEGINELASHLNRAQKEQTRGSEQVMSAIEAIRSVADSQNKSVKQLEEAIETLRQQADVLRGEIRRFRV